ncbi:hypothetical protein Leryth_018499 [Lithospermum erythrorhizon]|nr:hypothetical protein Leryth_018499 [Lithospermum erythrorhizon]
MGTLTPDVTLESCVESNCLPRPPTVVQVERGISAAVFVDNKAYREFLYKKFNAAPVDMETAAVALICRALSDLAGGGGALSNEADIFAPLASVNAVTVFINFISLLKETQNVYTS